MSCRRGESTATSSVRQQKHTSPMGLPSKRSCKAQRVFGSCQVVVAVVVGFPCGFLPHDKTSVRLQEVSGGGFGLPCWRLVADHSGTHQSVGRPCHRSSSLVRRVEGGWTKALRMTVFFVFVGPTKGLGKEHIRAIAPMPPTLHLEYAAGNRRSNGSRDIGRAGEGTG